MQQGSRNTTWKPWNIGFWQLTWREHSWSKGVIWFFPILPAKQDFNRNFLDHWKLCGDSGLCSAEGSGWFGHCLADSIRPWTLLFAEIILLHNIQKSCRKGWCKQILPALHPCNAEVMVGHWSLLGKFSKLPSSHPVWVYISKRGFPRKKIMIPWRCLKIQIYCFGFFWEVWPFVIHKYLIKINKKKA